MNAKRCKWKKSRELKEGGALLMKNGLYTLIINDLRLVHLPLKTSAPHHPVSGGGARFVIFWLSGCYMHKTGKSAPPSLNSLDFFTCTSCHSHSLLWLLSLLCSSTTPSLYRLFVNGIWNGLTTDLQRTWNGLGTEVDWGNWNPQRNLLYEHMLTWVRRLA